MTALKVLLKISASAALMLMLAPALQAHYPILVHDAGLETTQGAVTLTYALGHPYELDLEPVARPERVQITDSRGRVTNVTERLEATLFRGDTNAGAWQVRFEPDRGDHLAAFDSALSIDRAAKTVYQEYAKVCIHRGLQEGWNRRTGQPLEIVPLTRPYGLRAGAVFTGRLMRGEAPVIDTEIQVERLSERRPDRASLPPAPLITMTVRTDRDGRFAVSLLDPGWWIIGAYVDELGSVQREGEQYQLDGFAGLWVRVEDGR
jgi:cobalt/nickel transport protein